VQHEHPILNGPLTIDHEAGRLEVLKRQAKDQNEMGAALTLDGTVNSIDAELIATGPSAKGPNRGAIVRHGRYVLWAFEGPISNMTNEGRKLFVNTVCYAAAQSDAPVLERHMNDTRDKLYGSLEYVQRVPGYLNTIKRLDLPKDMGNAKSWDVRNWLDRNRPYLRIDGRRGYMVDEFAKELEIPNHRIAFLDKCIQCLERGDRVEQALAALKRYTGHSDWGVSAPAWRQWLSENAEYLYFSDSDGFRFLIDAEAKAKGIPTARLRHWSSESLDYKFHPPGEAVEATDKSNLRR